MKPGTSMVLNWAAPYFGFSDNDLGDNPDAIIRDAFGQHGKELTADSVKQKLQNTIDFVMHIKSLYASDQQTNNCVAEHESNTHEEAPVMKNE